MKVQNVKDILNYIKAFNDNNTIIIKNGELKISKDEHAIPIKWLRKQINFINENTIVTIPCDGILKIGDNYHIILDDNMDITCDKIDGYNVYQYYKNGIKVI